MVFRHVPREDTGEVPTLPLSFFLPLGILRLDGLAACQESKLPLPKSRSEATSSATARYPLYRAEG